MLPANTPQPLRLFLGGLYAAIPVATGYIPVAITYGLIVRSVGLSAADGVIASLLVFAGAAQFLALSLFNLGTSMYQILFAGWMLNVRHLLMSSVVARTLPPIKPLYRGLLSFGITDEVFGVLVSEYNQHTPVSRWRVAGLEAGAYSAWVLGTLAGTLVGEVIPPLLRIAMGLALYVLFTALVTGQIQRGPRTPVAVAALTGAGVHTILRSFTAIGAGAAVPVAMIAGGILGAAIFRESAHDD